ncbi:MAG: hypothetical protein Q9187_007783, partial [Circinaria calcarea]
KDVNATNAGLSYGWYEMTFFTRWERNHSIILCIDTPSNTKSMLETALSRDLSTLNLMDPFAIYVPLIDHIIMLYDRSIWGIRDLIRNVEKLSKSHKTREKNYDFELDFPRLHEISRHSIHCCEVLTVAAETTSQLTAEQKEVCTRIYQPPEKLPRSFDTTHKHLSFQMQFIRNLKFRSESNQQRLQAEITLAYNTIAERDSKVMVAIGKAAKNDSTAMKTVAVVTITYLPATFTSALFGMSFFDFSPSRENQSNEWRVSEKIWIYWVTALLLTLLTMGVWLVWQYSERLGARSHGLSKRRLRAEEIQKYASGMYLYDMTR